MNGLSRLFRFINSLKWGSSIRISNLKDSPIIICGCARSGTTLVHAILSAHPSIQPIQAESRIFKNYPFNTKGLNRLYHRIQVWNHLVRRPIKPTATRWMEKTPQNVLFIDRILEEFDHRVQVINVVRDGRDVVTSIHPSRPNQYFVTPAHWAQQVQAGLKWKNHPQVKTILYEDLVSDHEKTIGSLLSWLALPYSQQVKEFPAFTLVKKPKSLKNDVESVHRKSVGKWKQELHQDRVGSFYQCKEAVLMLQKLGYEH